MSKKELHLYTSKIPSAVKKAMLGFCGSECYLIKRRKKGRTSEGPRGQCHLNVDGLVKRIGGKSVSGWMLERNNALLVKGIWVWSFHSVWQTPENEVVDVTRSQVYEGKDFTTVWFDTSRVPDLKVGKAYNNVIVFESKSSAAPFSKHFGRSLQEGVPYWVTPNFEVIADLEEHSGIYRWTSSAYPKNRQRFETEYDCKFVNGRLEPNGDAKQGVPNKALLDYSLSM